MPRLRLALCTLLSLAASAAYAKPTIVIGGHDLLPNTPGQKIDVFVTGGDAVEGLNFFAQIADGGPTAGGAIKGPKLTANLVASTIFSANNDGVSDLGSTPQSVALALLTTSGSVSANGRLATLTLDTTGFTSGSWPLSMARTINGPTDFAGLAATITDGSITIVPEPSVAAFALIGVGGLFSWRRRRKW